VEDLSIANYTLSPHTFVQAEHCPRARVYRGPKQATSQANWHGIAVHLFLQYAVDRGRDYAMGYIRRKFRRLEAFFAELDLSPLPEDGTVEPQFIINTRERMSVLVAKGEERGLADPRQHVIVRGDLLATTPDEAPWVIDYKSGKNPKPPHESLQSMIEAAAAFTAHPQRPPYVRASVFNVTRVEETNRVTIVQQHHQFDANDIEQILTRIRRVHLSVLETRAELRDEGIEPEAVPGEWCRYCQANSACDRSAFKE